MLKLYKNLKPYSGLIALIVVLVFVQAITQLYLPTLMSEIVDKGIVNGDINYIIRIGVLMLLVALIGTIATVGSSFLASRTAVKLSHIIRGKLFKKVESYSLSEFDQIGAASLITRTTNDITQVERVTVMLLRMMLFAPLMCIGGIVMAFSKDSTLTLILVVVMPVLGGLIFLLARKVIPYFKQIQKKVDKLNLVLREGLIGIRVIRAFNRTAYEDERFARANRDLTDISVKAYQLMAALMPLLMLMMNLTTVAIIWFGGIRIDQGAMQVGDLMAFVQYIMQIMLSLIMLSITFVLIPRASASAVRINQVIDLSPRIKDVETEVAGNKHKKGFVEFKEVSFSYPGAEEAAIKGVSFQAKPGEVTAIIGGTGSGKSTLINLILRFYDLSEGQILIDDVDVREMKQKTLREKIGLVPQKAILFTGSIAENIRFGKETATDEEIRYAASVAQAKEFIETIEGGFHALIAQGGNNLSGGQKQRLSIARALVRKPEIYLFDDSFSALDFKTDAKLREALANEIKSSTVIIVAQRVSTIMDADRIIVLDEGEVVGIGKHKELLSSCDVYREIVTSQLSEEELA